MRLGLHTDHYELTMLDAVRHAGIFERPAVFEVFARRLPRGRRYGVVAGTARLAELVPAFGFDQDEVEWLARESVVSRDTAEALLNYRFTGRITGYREGELYFPHSPVLTVTGTFGDAVILETLALSVLNHDSAVASAGARMRSATDATLLEFGGRRTHEEAAVSAARAAYLVGFDATSNLEAGRRYSVPTAGTAAHAYTLVHDDETQAFCHQIEALGIDTTLLVDTYAIDDGIKNAVAAARSFGATGPGAIRIDSGDLDVETRRARALLDELGATSTRIVVSGDLDEYVTAQLEDNSAGRAPVDGYGIGTRLVTGSGHPTAGFVYKLVAVGTDLREDPRRATLTAVEKASVGKQTKGGAKRAWRHLADARRAVAEDLRTDGQTPADSRSLQVAVLDGTEVTYATDLQSDREHHRRALTELAGEAVALADGEPAIPTLRNGLSATHPQPPREEAP